MRERPTKVTDHAKMIDQILAAGASQAELGAAMGVVMTNRMLRAYRNGIQPLPHRAAAIERFWAEKTGKKRMPTKAAA